MGHARSVLPHLLFPWCAQTANRGGFLEDGVGYLSNELRVETWRQVWCDLRSKTIFRGGIQWNIFCSFFRGTFPRLRDLEGNQGKSRKSRKFHRISKKFKGSGLAGGLKNSPDLENPRNLKKIQGNPWKSSEFPSKILENPLRIPGALGLLLLCLWESLSLSVSPFLLSREHGRSF